MSIIFMTTHSFLFPLTLGELLFFLIRNNHFEFVSFSCSTKPWLRWTLTQFKTRPVDFLKWFNIYGFQDETESECPCLWSGTETLAVSIVGCLTNHQIIQSTCAWRPGPKHKQLNRQHDQLPAYLSHHSRIRQINV